MVAAAPESAPESAPAVASSPRRRSKPKTEPVAPVVETETEVADVVAFDPEAGPAKRRGRPRKPAAETPETAVEPETASAPPPEPPAEPAPAAQGEAETSPDGKTIDPSPEIAPRAVSGDSTGGAVLDSREPEAVLQVAPGSVERYVDPRLADMLDWRRKVEIAEAEVADADEAVADAETELAAAKKVLKEAESAKDAAVERMRKIVRENPEKNPLPLFAKREEPAALPPAPATGPKPTSPSTDPADSWRADDVAVLDVASGVKEKLRAAGIDTIGALSDFVAPSKGGYCKRYSDIDGVGAATAEKIEEAMMRYWETRPARAAAPAPASVPAAEAVVEAPDDEADFAASGEAFPDDEDVEDDDAEEYDEVEDDATDDDDEDVEDDAE